MTPTEIKNFAQAAAPVLRGYIEEITRPLLARIDALESRVAEPGPKGEKGDPGEGVDKAELDLMFADAVRDSQRLFAEATANAIRNVVEEEVAKLPPGKPGEPGKDGAPGVPGEKGADGADGRDGASVEDLRPIVEELVAAAMATIPLPKDGRDGIDGKDGQPGEKGEAGPAGEKGDPGEPGERGDPGPAGERGVDGKDGVGLAGALISREGSLILTMTDGRTCDLGFVVGKDGRDGSDGKEGERGPAGFSLDSFDTEMKDGGRTLVLKFATGDRTETHELGIDAMIYRGVFKQGSEYERGDVVTWGGSLWHCNQPTGAKPDDSRDGVPWSMAVRRGRDGKDGEKGQKGDPGPKGRA